MHITASSRLRVWPSWWQSLRLGRRGVAALEFALASPILILTLMSMYDITNAWLSWRRLTASSQSVGQIATLLAVNADGTNSLTPEQAWRASTAAYASMPALLTPNTQYSVTLSQVLFTTQPACNGASCAAYVGWSKGILGAAAARPCGWLTAVADDAAPGPSVMPQSTFQRAPILVVDMTYAFTPLFLGGVVGPIKMARSSYFPARSGNLDQSTAYLDSSAQCPIPQPPEDQPRPVQRGAPVRTGMIPGHGKLGQQAVIPAATIRGIA